MQTKPVILVDMDGVLVDLVPTWLSTYLDHGGEAVFPEDVTYYDFTKVVKDSELLYKCLATESVFERCAPMPGARAFRDLYQNPNLEVHVVSYVHPSCDTGEQQKRAWMASYFPDFPQENMTFTKHKHLIRGDVLIEDSPYNIAAWAARNPEGTTICVKAPYNFDNLANFTVNNLSGVAEILSFVCGGSNE